MQRRPWLLGGIAAVFVAVGAAAGFVWSGTYNVAADVEHTRPVHAVLETVRKRSIARRAAGLHPPSDLMDAERIRQGSGNYDAMCAGCHLAPGMAETELSLGLYPAPPNLSEHQVAAAEAFWVIKHGIKASGMPAWGGSMGDEYIWNMAAFLRELPTLGAAEYQTLVASSDGHSHGGGETADHAHGSGDHHADADAGHSGSPEGHHHHDEMAPEHDVQRNESSPHEHQPTVDLPNDDGHDHDH
ncbi:c-type cytochrome [Luteimonas sp. JM171]|uniref:c-type cytochrome n=1 Tax=Luteimonas sp. JM171 TaxID=1896164 RepID=UPI000A685147|nr:cytochrome c [Luteimonas sp. JM171]